MAELVRIGTAHVAVRVYRGRWLYDCPWCNGADFLGEVTLTIDCSTCDAPLGLLWPPEATRHGIARLLAMRPHPDNRNWLPGETLIDLMVENGQHGVFDGLELGTPGTEALVVDEATIRVDHLPAITTHSAKAVSA